MGRWDRESGLQSPPTKKALPQEGVKGIEIRGYKPLPQRESPPTRDLPFELSVVSNPSYQGECSNVDEGDKWIRKFRNNWISRLTRKRVAQVVEVSEAPALNTRHLRERCSENGTR